MDANATPDLQMNQYVVAALAEIKTKLIEEDETGAVKGIQDLLEGLAQECDQHGLVEIREAVWAGYFAVGNKWEDIKKEEAATEARLEKLAEDSERNWRMDLA